MQQQTPLMQQYHKMKQEYPDTILLYRVGDFFETFDDDAKTASRVLGITLTKRSNGAAGDTPLAGFPHHALETYLPKLVRAGFRVAVCEQVENPKFAKGIVKRDVVEVVTPGVAFSDKLLDHKRNNYLAAISPGGDITGISFSDVTTGEFYTFEVLTGTLGEQIELIAPAEILVSKRHFRDLETPLKRYAPHARISKVDEWIFNSEYAKDALLMRFNTVSLKGFGIERLTQGVVAAGVIVHYLQETQKANLPHLNKIALYNPSDFMMLDGATKRNLEITVSMQEGGRDGSLFGILDKTFTPMGGRLLKKWISAPLKKVETIIQRQEAVEELLQKKVLRKEISGLLSEIGDLERLISKICTGRANPREIIALKSSLLKIPEVITALGEADNNALLAIRKNLTALNALTGKIEMAMVEHPPLNIADGGVIKRGYSIELDELRDISLNGRDWIANLQKQERDRTGISSLKISYNRVFGYYIEISHANKDKVPADYLRKQTLTNAERFITPALKEYEEKVLSADEKIYELESQLFQDLRATAATEAEPIQSNARFIAMLDCLLSFALCADEYKYTRPEVNESTVLEIINGRHPVIERILPPGEKFTPNSCTLNNEEESIILLTGPNMAGKSVYLRQTGLIILLAQIGSFVPAEKAVIGVVDRIFTRVGASDNIAAGESTFLVEMQEAANILNNATDRSLVLLDEIGRGTSTFDGISIAWAITEYLHDEPKVCAKTLFATHYHELNEMATIFPRIKNYKVEVREYGDKVIFMHKVTPGFADHSYGIQVAQMAGLPKSVTERAKEILANLEGKELTPYQVKKERLAKIGNKDYLQMSLFDPLDDTLRKELISLSVDSMTPIEALNKLNQLKKQVSDETPSGDKHE